MFEKERYESPEMEVVKFANEDIIVASGGGDSGGEGGL